MLLLIFHLQPYFFLSKYSNIRVAFVIYNMIRKVIKKYILSILKPDAERMLSFASGLPSLFSLARRISRWQSNSWCDNSISTLLFMGFFPPRKQGEGGGGKTHLTQIKIKHFFSIVLMPFFSYQENQKNPTFSEFLNWGHYSMNIASRRYVITSSWDIIPNHII